MSAAELLPPCACCGSDAHPLRHDMRFMLPDAVIAAPDAPRAGDDIMMAVEGVGAFVRSLLTVALTDGHTMTYAIWLEVDPTTLQLCLDIWQTASYPTLALRGRLANALPSWPDVVGAEVLTEVRNAWELPYVVSSTHPAMADVIAREWPHQSVLEASYGGES